MLSSLLPIPLSPYPRLGLSPEPKKMATFSTKGSQPFHRNLPFVAHQRLTAPQAPPPRSKVRNSVLMAEIDRINHRVRPHPAYVPTEDWLNSACSVVQPYPQFSTAKMMRFVVLPLTYKMKNLDSSVPTRFRYQYKDNFDDETRSIRAQTAALLKRVHSPVPRSRGPLHVVLPTPSSLMETPVPHRHTSDHYIEGLLAPINKVQRDVTSRSFYVQHPRPYIGKGNLACVSFAGGKAYTKRRAHYDVPEDHHNVQDDIATLSYYNRARAVANGQEPGPEPAATASTRKSRPYRSTTDSAPAAAPAPIKQASVKEDPVAEAAAEAELAAEKTAPAVVPAPEAAPTTNGTTSEDDEAARLAAEEAELERQLEAELLAEMEAKEAKKAKKAAAKKAKEDEEAKQAAEEAEAKRLAEEAAAKKAEEEEAVAAAAAAEVAAAAAVAEAAAAAEAESAAEAARKAAEEEAELERLVAAELEAEAKKAEEDKAAAQAVAEQEVSNEETAEAEAVEESAVETETEVPAEEAEPETEPEPEPESEPEPVVAEAETEYEPAASPEPEAIAEDDPVVEEPLSEAVRDDAEDARSDGDAGWPMDDE